VAVVAAAVVSIQEGALPWRLWLLYTAPAALVGIGRGRGEQPDAVLALPLEDIRVLHDVACAIRLRKATQIHVPHQ